MANCGRIPGGRSHVAGVAMMSARPSRSISFESIQELAIRMAGRPALHARRKRSARNSFISFISLISMLGIALGVAALIMVLSVMNGFEKEVARPHPRCWRTSRCPTPAARMPDWQQTAAKPRWSNPEVMGAAPFVPAQGMLTARRRGARRLRARRAAGAEDQGADVGQHMSQGSFDDLRAGRVQHRARHRTGARAARAGGRQGDADRAAGPGHAGRRDAAPEAVHRGRHLRGRPHRVRLGARPRAPGGRAAPLPAGRRRPACACSWATCTTAPQVARELSRMLPATC